MRFDDPVADAADYYGARDKYENKLELARESEQRLLLLAASIGDMKAKAGFAPLVTDWPKVYGTYGDKHAKRVQTVGEVLGDALTDDTRDEAMSLLCELAQDKANPLHARAAKLIERMAWDYACEVAEVDE